MPKDYYWKKSAVQSLRISRIVMESLVEGGEISTIGNDNSGLEKTVK